MSNIRVIDYYQFAKRINYTAFENPWYHATVDYALRKYLTSEQFDTVVNGYRRSTWSEEYLLRDFEKLNTNTHNVLKDEHYWKAIDEMNKRFRPTKTLFPVHYADLREYPWRLATNIGAPYNIQPVWINQVKAKYKLGLTTDMNMTKHNLYNEFFNVNRFLYHRIKTGHTTDNFGNDLKHWNTAFARLHLVKDTDPDKVRLVFGAPTLLLQAEMAFVWPIEVSLLNKGDDSPMLWRFETITGGWYRLRNWFATKHPRLLTYFTFDWSSFDRLARHDVISDIHTCWKTWFNFEHYWPTQKYPISTPDPLHMRNLWNWMNDAILHTPLLLPDGRLIRFSHSGIFSGYLQTQLLDSCYNMVMILTILSRMGFDITKVVLKVQGDDSLGGILNYIPPPCYESFINMFKFYADIYFGAIVNMKKSELHPTLEDVEVLKYRNTGGIPYRPELELLAMLKHPERSQSISNLMARVVGIAYAACGRSHLVYTICEDIYLHLKKKNIVPNVYGLPGGISYLQRDIEGIPFVDVTRFPSFFETMMRLTSTSRTLVSSKLWNTDHFIGIPI